MTERPLLSRRRGARARSGTPAVPLRHEDTLPALDPLPPPTGDPALLGFPAEEAPPGDGAPPADEAPAEHLVSLRSADPVAGSLLLVAGVAGAMSLFLPWVGHDRELGLPLAERGLAVLDRGLDDLARSGLLLPLGLVVAGGGLFLLGLLAFRPARTHRTLGVAALAVSLAVAAGVVVRSAAVGGSGVLRDPGTVCAVVLAAAGLLGALKAMLTAPEVTSEG